MDVEREAGLAIGADVSRVILTVKQKRIEGSVSERSSYGLLRWNVFGEKIDRSAERGGSDGGCRAGAAVEVYAADPLSGKEGPRVMAGRVCILKGNAVPCDVEVTVLEAAEGCCALSEAYSVGVDREDAGNDLYDLAVIGHRRGELLNELGANL